MSILDEGFRPGSTPSRSRPHGNLAALRIAVILAFGLLAARLFSMQIVDGASYAKRSAENHIYRQNILPTRGLILGRDGTPLVENVGVYTAMVRPELLPSKKEDRQKIYLKLEELVGVPALQVQDLVARAEADNQAYLEFPVRKNLTKEQALMLDEASSDMPGVSLSVTPGRNYIGGDDFSHILGYIGPQTAEEYQQLGKAGYSLNEPVGKDGLEAQYEDDLRGKAGASQVEQDAQGRVINVLKNRDAVPGNSLKLAIDPGLQQYVAELLDGALQLDGWDATVAAAVVMSPKTGEVYALVSLPGYDNNIFAGADDGTFAALSKDPRKPFLNRALSAEAPGSTFKLITASAALQEGNITPTTGRQIGRVLEIKGENGQIYPFYDWKDHNAYLNVVSGLAWSSNIFFYMASCGIPQEGRKGLGKTLNDAEGASYTLGNYARAYGLGGPTGIDLAGESWGLIPNPDQKRKDHSGSQFGPEDREWFYGDTCFMGIGQGDVKATPLQIARMTAAVANGGKLLTPHVVNEVLSPTGDVIRTIKTESKQVPVSPQNLAVVRQGMHESVGYGAGAKAFVPGIDIAGKTGTAEFGPLLANGKPAQHAWFTGFAPFDDPEVVVTVYFDLGIGGDKAAPVAGRIFDYFMRNVKP